MNIIREIKELITRIDQYVEAEFESNELIAQVKILNGKIERLKHLIESGKIDDAFSKKYDELKAIQYSIHHQLLFGPLSRILGLVDLIEKEVEHGRSNELNNLVHLLTKETTNLKSQVMQILEGSDDMEKGEKQ
jgi:hypothetical protein